MTDESELREMVRQAMLPDAASMAVWDISPRAYAALLASTIRDMPPWSENAWAIVERLERGDYDRDIAAIMGLA